MEGGRSLREADDSAIDWWIEVARWYLTDEDGQELPSNAAIEDKAAELMRDEGGWK